MSQKTNVCTFCGKTYIPIKKLKKNLFCSRSCKDKNRSKDKTKVRLSKKKYCYICGILVPPEQHNTKTLVCSKECLNKKKQIRYKNKKINSVKLLGNKCKFCGYNTCIDAFDFHHVNPTNKDTDIGQLLNCSWERIKKELEKCILLCCVCHREEHHRWKQLGINSEKQKEQKTKAA